MIDNKSTKKKILNAALDLFSTQGFEATSVSQLADAVGIRKASVYSHFESKQDILNALMQNISEQYEKNSIFSETNRDKASFSENGKAFNVDAVTKMITGHIRYILHDPQISKARKMLTIEQFRNPLLSEMQTRRNYTNVMNFFTDVINCLIQQKKLSGDDAEIMAAQLCLPVSVWLNLCDREPEREDEIINLIERHVRLFFSLYRKDSAENRPPEAAADKKPQA